MLSRNKDIVTVIPSNVTIHSSGLALEEDLAAPYRDNSDNSVIGEEVPDVISPEGNSNFDTLNSVSREVFQVK